MAEDLNKVYKKKTGFLRKSSQYSVRAKTSYDGELEFNIGDRIADIKDAQALVDADPRMDFQQGECGVLANALWNSNRRVKDYIVLTTKTQKEDGIHQLVRLSSGLYADSLGIWTHETLLEYWLEVDKSIELKLWEDIHPESKDDKPSGKPDGMNPNSATLKIVNRMIEKYRR